MRRILSVIIATIFVATLIPFSVIGSESTEKTALPAAYTGKYYKEKIAAYEGSGVTATVTEGKLPVGMDIVPVEEKSGEKTETVFYLAGTTANTGVAEHAFTVSYEKTASSSDTTEGIKDSVQYTLSVEYPTRILRDAYVGTEYKEYLLMTNINLDTYKTEVKGDLPKGLEIKHEDVLPHMDDERDIFVRFYVEGKPDVSVPEKEPYSATFTLTVKQDTEFPTERTFTIFVNDTNQSLPVLESGTNTAEYKGSLIQIEKDETVVYTDKVPEGMEIVTESEENSDKQSVFLKGMAKDAGIYHFCIGIAKTAVSSEAATETVRYLSARIEIQDKTIAPVTGYVGEYYNSLVHTMWFDKSKEIFASIKEGTYPEGLNCRIEGMYKDNMFKYDFFLEGVPKTAGFYNVELEIFENSKTEPIGTISFDLTVLGADTQFPFVERYAFAGNKYDDVFWYGDTKSAYIDLENTFLLGNCPDGLSIEQELRSDTGEVLVHIKGKPQKSSPYRYIIVFDYYLDGIGRMSRTFTMYVSDKGQDLGRIKIGTDKEIGLAYVSDFKAKSFGVIKDCEGVTITPKMTNQGTIGEMYLNVKGVTEGGRHIMLLRFDPQDGSESKMLYVSFEIVKNYTGDANLDGKVNTGDSTLILKYAANMVTLNEEQLKYADVTKDGKVNTGDAAKILRYCAGMEDLPKD